MSRATRLLSWGATLAAACGGGDAPSAPPTPTGMEVAAGDLQAGQVGQPLPTPVAIRVTRSGGAGVAGVRVDFLLPPGAGTVSFPTALTDASGIAQVVWTLGTAAGEQTLTVRSGTLPAVTVRASAEAGPPWQVVPVAGAAQFAVVGRLVDIRPQGRVADTFGNPLPGHTVTFRVTAGGGTITDSVQASDANGLVTLGSWKLGPGAGINRVRAQVNDNVGVDFLAAGVPARIEPIEGDGLTANAGTAVPIPPAALAVDDEGHPLAGVDVGFSVRSGGGRIVGASIRRTGADGIARLQGWVLGAEPGTNTIETVVGGVGPARFSVEGVPGVPASLTLGDGPAATGFVGNFLSTLPVVVVRDAEGNPVFGALVQFQVVSGGGAVFGSQVSDADGRVVPGGWRLGPLPGAQRLEASVAGAAPLTVSAEATTPPPSAFHIELRFLAGEPTESQRAAFEGAAARWQQAIIGDIPDVLAQVEVDPFGCYPAMDEVIDDVVIFVRLVPIDGPGNVLGRAGPCLVRTGSFLPAVGIMEFDTADLVQLETSGTLQAVMLHEMGHVIGFIAGIWDVLGIAEGIGGADPFFRGITARGAFLGALGPAGYAGNIVPLENLGGSGSRDSHWREQVVGTELMTSLLTGTTQPLSAFTISAFRDMGYVVNDAVADEFTLATALAMFGGPRLEMRHGPIPWPVRRLGRDGRVAGFLPN